LSLHSSSLLRVAMNISICIATRASNTTEYSALSWDNLFFCGP
jgi:hypothetical protein